MFRDELAGNASRKRQEQARERRRKLKLEQQRKEQLKVKSQKLQSKKKEDSSKEAANGTDLTTSISDVNVAISSKSNLGLEVGKKPLPSNINAVSQAIEQRKIRVLRKLHESSAIVIQSFYRSFKSNKKLEADTRSILHKRVSDLITLTKIIEDSKIQPENEKSGAAISAKYVPPPALAMGMLYQLLYICHTTPRFHFNRNIDNENMCASAKQLTYFSKIRNDMSKIDIELTCSVIRYILLPGIKAIDEHLDPMIGWLNSKEGEYRLKKVLRLCCFMLVAARNASSTAPLLKDCEVYHITEFLSALLGITQACVCARENLVKACRTILLDSSSSPLVFQPGGINIGKIPVSYQSLDLIYILRSYLIFPSGEAKAEFIIPTEAEKKREACISSERRKRGDRICNLVMTAILVADDQNIILLSRFFRDCLTCPLFAWKVDSTVISKLVNVPIDKDFSEAPLFSFLRAFVESYGPVIADGEIITVLHSEDVPLSLCPSPVALTLLANLVHLGTHCPAINGNGRHFDFDCAVLYFNFMSYLLSVVPLGAFSSRESAVEWMDNKGHLTPVVLPTVIRDQCKIFLADSHVRRLMNIAIDNEVLNTEKILSTKNSNDMKHESEMREILRESAVSVAAQEAKVDRSKGFWQSKWAKRLSKQMGSMFSSKQDNSNMTKGSQQGRGALMNTSQISKSLARNGGEKGSKIPASLTYERQKEETDNINKSHPQSFNKKFLFALCHSYAVIISRWGGGGNNRIINHATEIDMTNVKKGHATDKPDLCVFSLLNVLCFSTTFIKTSWALIQSQNFSDLNQFTEKSTKSHPMTSLKQRAPLNATMDSGNLGTVLLLMFIVTLTHSLIITDDIELHEMDRPIPSHQIRRCIVLLKNILHRAFCLDDRRPSHLQSCNQSDSFGLSLVCASSKLMTDLHDRSSRRALCMPKLWLIDQLLESQIKNCKKYEDYCNLLNTPILRTCPFLVSFKRRLKLFERLVTTNRQNIQGRNDGHSFRPGVHVNITRGRVLEDGLIHLNKLGRDLRKRLIVSYVNEAGVNEAGLDAGGLFKEFWTDLSTQSFDPNYALFLVTEQDGCLYPNPSSRAAHGQDSIVLFQFLGRILGKSLYEGITIQPQFAHFFLSFLKGDYNYLHMLPDLHTMDATLYNNLMFLKTYEGDASDLCLTFAISTNEFGNNSELDLIPNGANIEVTDNNKHRYIELMAKYHVCDRLKEQSEAFTRGLWDVIDKRWLGIFNEPELQVLISGPADGMIDVLDMKANTHYVGGYHSLDRHISRFWKVVSSLDKKQQAHLLRFVTSCERPPPLGFASMNPPFTIQRVSGNKLPTASTCFNVLKLPVYNNEHLLRERLIYAIECGTGFELA